ncbi:MAG: OpgC domain-containing protein, partial [Burkholderiales bacterium]
MERQAELDWLRGMMLVLMTMTHLPTWFSAHAGQPFGFVSAAEGFVFLSAFLVGAVYSQKTRERGYRAMRRALWGRALKVYA